MMSTSLDFGIYGYKARARLGRSSRGTSDSDQLSFSIELPSASALQADLPVGTIISTTGEFPETWEDSGVTVIIGSINLPVDGIRGTYTSYPAAKALLEAAAVYQLRRTGLGHDAHCASCDGHACPDVG